MFPHPCDRVGDQLTERREIDVVEALDVQATLPQFMFPEFRKERIVRGDFGHQIDRQILFARGEPGYEPISLAASGVFVVVTAEPDDARSPHRRAFAGYFFHQGEEGPAIAAFVFVFDAIDEGFDAGVGRLGFILGHFRFYLGLRLCIRCTGGGFSLR